jgi:hypothetical protein
MIYFLPAIVLLSVPSGLSVGLAAWCIAVDLVLQVYAGRLSMAQELSLMVVALGAPLAGMLAGMLINRYCFPGAKLRGLVELSTLLAICLVLGTSQVANFLEAAVRVRESGSALADVLLIISAGNYILFGGAATALAVMLPVAVIELCSRWIISVSGSKLEVSFAAIRPLLAVLLITLGFNLVSGMFLAELSPTQLIHHLW